MIDVHIIGQGLAGSVAALEFLSRGKSVFISNNPDLSQCSRTAAGLFNPLNFKTLSRTWNADTVFPAATAFYKNTEQQLHLSFWHPLPMLRIIGSEGEKKEWEKGVDSNSFNNYLSPTPIPPHLQTFNKGFGLGMVNHCGYLDTNTFLEGVKAFLIEKKIYAEKTCKTPPEKTTDGWRINGIESRHILFCEGWKAIENPLFNWLPFEPVKGEVIMIEEESLELDHLINAGCFVLPVGNHQYRIGSTFVWDELDDTPTLNGKEELRQKGEKVLGRKINIRKQWAGVRPATGDRRPYLGEHPKEKGIWIFNGLGTRGVILAPWLSQQLAETMFNGASLPHDADIKRHLKRYRTQ